MSPAENVLLKIQSNYIHHTSANNVNNICINQNKFTLLSNSASTKQCKKENENKKVTRKETERVHWRGLRPGLGMWMHLVFV